VALSDPQLTAVLGVLVVLSLAALALGVAALLGQRRVRRAYAVFTGGRRQDVLSLLEHHIEQVATLRQEVAGLRDDTAALREIDRHTLRHTSMVRYDAFEDMGGYLSFSAALLDETADGLVLTAINGRTETRVYAKPIEGGDSRHNLSDEERAAIERALQESGGERETGPKRRRRSRRDDQRRRSSPPAEPVERS